VRPWVWLRGLAVVLAMFTVGHTLGTAAPRVTRGEEQRLVVAAMQDHHFPVMGYERSYWDFYRGFAFTISALLAMMTAIAWQLAAISRRSARQALPMTVSLLAGCAALLALSQLFFFGGPVLMSAVAMACAVVALVAVARRAGQERLAEPATA